MYEYIFQSQLHLYNGLDDDHINKSRTLTPRYICVEIGKVFYFVCFFFFHKKQDLHTIRALLLLWVCFIVLITNLICMWLAFGNQHETGILHNPNNKITNRDHSFLRIFKFCSSVLTGVAVLKREKKKLIAYSDRLLDRPRPPSTISTCRPVNYTCNLSQTATQKSSSAGHLLDLVSFSVYSFQFR